MKEKEPPESLASIKARRMREYSAAAARIQRPLKPERPKENKGLDPLMRLVPNTPKFRPLRQKLDDRPEKGAMHEIYEKQRREEEDLLIEKEVKHLKLKIYGKG
jgi:spore germination cell wall hydrolase CwlJ-like protein